MSNFSYPVLSLQFWHIFVPILVFIKFLILKKLKIPLGNRKTASIVRFTIVDEVGHIGDSIKGTFHLRFSLKGSKFGDENQNPYSGCEF